jgi:hypothetical protein
MMVGISSLKLIPLLLTPCTLGYKPVVKVARLGMQMGLVQKQFENLTPPFANLSRLGVFITGFPAQPM